MTEQPFTIVPESLKEWNVFFSREVEINVNCQQSIAITKTKSTMSVKYLGCIDINQFSKDAKQQKKIETILNSKKYDDSTMKEIENLMKESKSEDIVKLNCQFSNETSLIKIQFDFIFLLPFLKLNLLLIVIEEREKLLCCIPLKGLTSFVLQIPGNEVAAVKKDSRGGQIAENFVLDRKMTTSFVSILKSLQQLVIRCQLKGNTDSQAVKKLFQKQVEIHQSLRCSQISSFLYSVPDKHYLLFEKPKYWTLTSYIKQNNGFVAKMLAYKFCIDISKAMNYLQESQIVHRDLSTDSVFVYSVDPNDYVNCKLGDVCCCERVSENGVDSGMTKPIYSSQGENFRMPPEITSKDSNYTSQCDIYSFGILMFHILTGLVSTNPIGESGTVSPQFTRQIPSAFVNIINSCCAINMNERPKFSEVADRLNTILLKARKDQKKEEVTNKIVKVPLV